MKIDIRAPGVPYSPLPDFKVEELRNQPERTIVVLGVPRGGTTMMAGVTQRCGIWLGSGLPGNLEDPDFVKKPMDHMLEAVKKRNAERKVWGWKYPAAVRYLPELHDELRNPHYIIVLRDPLASGLRELRGGDKSLLQALMNKHRLQLQNLQFAKSARAPFLFVSYERAIAHPVKCAEAVARFTGGQVPEDLDELIEFMKPESYKPVNEEIGQNVAQDEADDSN